MDNLFTIQAEVNNEILRNNHFVEYGSITNHQLVQELANQLIRKKSTAIQKTQVRDGLATRYSLELVVLTRSELKELVQDKIKEALKNKENNG